uniref:Uncharacterized protein n=1 Tax=Tetranychus urticae TaxID=32264 RepID=T1JZN5_TETUR
MVNSGSSRAQRKILRPRQCCAIYMVKRCYSAVHIVAKLIITIKHPENEKFQLSGVVTFIGTRTNFNLDSCTMTNKMKAKIPKQR